MEEKDQKIIYSWNAPEFTYQPKGSGWLIGLFTITSVIIVFSLIMRNFFFSFLVLIAAFLVYIQAHKRPRRINFSITETGIGADGRFYPYKSIVSFWIFEEPELNCLSLETKIFLQPRISIPLGQEKPEQIKNLISKFIKEKKQEEHFSDLLARKLKF